MKMASSGDRLEIAKFRLEIAKTVIGGLLTIGVFLLGYLLNHRDQKQTLEVEHRRSVIAERFKRFDEFAPLLNEVYCYFEYVGTWKEFSPKDMIEHKRKLDGIVYSYAVLYDPKFLASYREFIDQTYQPYQSWPNDAALRTSAIRPKDVSHDGVLFTGEDNRAGIYDAYWALQKEAAEELDSNLTPGNSNDDREKVLSRQIPGK